MKGRLRVFLGAAPGVGKTFAMLEEAQRLKDEGNDVVVALVESHGRPATAALVEGLEVIARIQKDHSGLTLEELNVDAVIERAPTYAVVDELAHTNARGSANPKRWQDIDVLLEAGINVLTTVNVQHVASLNDVVEEITGIVQQETVPDSVLRAANQIELVDLAPAALRDRLAEGNVYPAERIDAALSNYFRLGNLTALRELALLWLADEVDSALNDYRHAHSIEGRWEARERVVVALTGGPEGETLLRRGARIAARSAGGELHAVHVNQNDGLARTNAAELAALRALVDTLGGTYHQVVGNDIPTALVEFAQGINATQLVIGLTRKTRLQSIVSGPGIGHAIIAAAGGIDVHIVNHAAAGMKPSRRRRRQVLTPRRLAWGFVVALLMGPALTALLVSLRSSESIIGDVLSYQLLVIIVALIGGRWPALFAAVMSGLSLDYFFIDPIHTVSIGHPLHAMALVLYVVNALLVSLVVDLAARRLQAARWASEDSELLANIAGSVFRGDDALTALVNQTREAFGLDSVELERNGHLVVSSPAISSSSSSHTPSGEPLSAVVERVNVGDESELILRGDSLAASQQRMLAAVVVQVEAVLEHQELEQAAQTVEPLERNDQVRSALLSAVSHDLRRPLAAAVAAVTSLRSQDVRWDEDDREELLTTAEESLKTLTNLVTNLLDATRLQAGVLAVSLSQVDSEEVIVSALDELRLGPDSVSLDLSETLPPVIADKGLLQRAVANVLANAHRFSPADYPVRISTSELRGTVEIRVIDHGPGISSQERPDVFVPFQRLGDTDNTTGLGLGLALSRGFMEGMGGSLVLEDTPGGGVTMVLALHAAPTGPGRAGELL